MHEMRSAILTYHAIDQAPSPLCIEPALFRAQLERIQELGWQTTTVLALANHVRAGSLPERTLALTFDDGFASVCEIAAPELEARRMTATVFCVAGHLGGRNDWPTDRAGGYVAPLCGAGDLRALAAAGIEIGAHGDRHAPLVTRSPDVLRRELLEARTTLEERVGSSIRSVAYPYGAPPSREAAAIVRSAYAAGCTTNLRRLRVGDDPFALPRIDAHYFRNPELLARLLDGRLDGYLRLRSRAARARRLIRKDYVHARPSP